MESLLSTVEQIDYNAEPVFYCTHCLSLAVKTVATFNFCDPCGSTDIAEINIHTWEKMYEEKYGIKYLNIKRNGRR